MTYVLTMWELRPAYWSAGQVNRLFGQPRERLDACPSAHHHLLKGKRCHQGKQDADCGPTRILDVTRWRWAGKACPNAAVVVVVVVELFPPVSAPFATIGGIPSCPFSSTAERQGRASSIGGARLLVFRMGQNRLA